MIAAESISVALIAAFAAVIVATLGLVGVLLQRGTAKQMKPIAKELQPNAGSSLRDAIDRIEAKIDDQVLPRLDGFATVQADHANRLAANEAATTVTNLAVAQLSQTKGPQ